MSSFAGSALAKLTRYADMLRSEGAGELLIVQEHVVPSEYSRNSRDRPCLALTGSACERCHLSCEGAGPGQDCPARRSCNVTSPDRGLTVGLKYFKEFSSSSTFQGNSFQISGAIRF
jgi:hypothetical protein